MRTPLLAPLLAQFVTLRPWSRTSSRAGSRHGSPRSGHRAFRVVHDHEYWNKLGLDAIYHTYAAVLAVNGIRPHQVLLERKIDDFSHKEAGDAIAAPVMILPDLTPSLSLSCVVGERTRTSYTEGCLYGGLSVYVCLALFLLGLDQLLFATRWSSLIFIRRS